MPKLYPIMSSFAAGEITPRFRLRADTDVYKNGVEIMRNFLSTSHGPATFRGGSRFVSTTQGDGGAIFPFEVSAGTGFIISFIKPFEGAPARIEVNDEGGSTQTASSEQLLDPQINAPESTSPWIDSTTSSGSVDYFSGFVQLADNSATIIQTVTNSDLNQGDEVEVKFNITAGPRFFRGDGSAIDPNLNVRFTVFSTGAGGTFQRDFGPFGIASSGQHAFTFTLPNDIGTDDLDFSLRFQHSARHTFYRINSASVTATAEQEGVEFDLTIAAGLTGDWNSQDIDGVQIDSPSGQNAIYIVTPRQPVTKLTFQTTGNIWTFVEVVFTAPPSEWTDTSNPAALCFFQGRLWYGGAPATPEQFWGSRTNDFDNFTEGSGTGDDALDFTLDQKGTIRWMRGAASLVIGTENDEFIVRGDNLGEVVAGNNVQIQRQSSFGSQADQAIQVGNKVLYISPDGRKIREIGFEWTDEQWVSRDLTFNSEHITEAGRNIIKIVWAQNPATLLIGIGQGGTIITATYERSYDIIGWHRQLIAGSDPDNPATALDVAVLRKAGIDEIWVLQRRNQEGLEDQLFVEKFNEAIFLDSGSEFDFGTETKSKDFSMPHLPNQLVQVVTNQVVDGLVQAGAVHPPVQLDANGDGVLDYEANRITAGFGYSGRILTMPVDRWSETGAMRPHKQHWNKIYAAILGSRLPIINGDRPAERTPASLMDTGEPLRTEYVKVGNLGHDRDQQVDIVQDQPFPCTVLGIFGELADDPM